MSCDHELAYEWARCSGKSTSCITKNGYATLFRGITVVYPTHDLYFLGILTRLKARVYQHQKIQVTRGIFHGIPFESVA